MSLYRNAVKSLVPEGTIFETVLDENGWRIGKWGSSEVTQPSEEAIQAKLKELKAEYDSQEYARTRKPLYPDIGDQLDALYHAGVFPKEMADKIKAVKDTNPKPE